MDEVLKKIVDIAVKSLRRENEFLATSIANNQEAYPNGGAALLRINNERYYQFVVARGLVESFDKAINLEKDSHDLVAYGSDGAAEIIVEMKRWMSSTGSIELNGIKSDIEQKLRTSSSKKALMLIYSANPPEVSIEENIRWLSDKLSIDYYREQWHWDSFPTMTIEGKSATFWVAGFEAR